ncbi:hypothetical protein UlMin_042529 [Ulmus minor]
MGESKGLVINLNANLIHLHLMVGLSLQCLPTNFGKISLLIQFTFNVSLEETHFSNRNAVFICNRNDEGIKKYFAAFHLHDTFPTVVVIDDFGDFFEEMYHFITLLCQETVTMFNTLLLFKFTRFSAKVGSGSFIQKSNNNLGNGISKRNRTAKYSIARQYLFLEEIMPRL